MLRSTLSSTLIALVVLTGCNKNAESSLEADAQPETAPSSVAEQNMVAGRIFLEEVSQRDGIQTTESGLMYEVITEGEGDKPNAASKVTVAYAGTFPDGREFDSSESISFALSRVIPGWTEGVQLMSPGAKYRFFIPSELGYGERGFPGAIPPNQALVFEIELFSFE